MKKVAFLVPDITNCGPVNVVKTIIKELYLTHKIYLVSIRKEGSDPEYINGITQYLADDPLFLSDTRTLSFKKMASRLHFFLTSNNISSIHAHGLIPKVVTGLLKNGSYKKIVTLHCIPHKDYLQEYGVLKGSLLCLLQYCVLNFLYFNAIVSCSYSVQKGVIGRSISRNRNRMHVIYNGVDNRVFTTINNKNREAQKKSLNINSAKKTYVYCGRLCRRKRVPELISLFKKSTNIDQAELYILGDGEELKEAIQAAENQPNIKFIGFTKNPSQYYQIADFVLSNSSAEGYPLSIIEAMLCGCKALLSPIPSHKEIIAQYPLQAASIKYLGNESEYFKSNIQQDLSALSSANMAQAYARLY